MADRFRSVTTRFVVLLALAALLASTPGCDEEAGSANRRLNAFEFVTHSENMVIAPNSISGLLECRAQPSRKICSVVTRVANKYVVRIINPHRLLILLHASECLFWDRNAAA